MRTSQEVDQKVGPEGAVGVRACSTACHVGLACSNRVLACMKDEWGALRLVESDYGSDKNHMIAAFIAVSRATLKTRRAAGEQRDVAESAFHCKRGEFIGP